MSSFDIIVIGDGIAARTILSALDPSYNVLQLYQNKWYPPATLAAGALASTYGARPGLSKLGNLNVDSYQFFKKFIQQMELPWSPATMQYFFKKSNEDENSRQAFQTRWKENGISEDSQYMLSQEEAYLIDPVVYMQLLLEKFQAKVQRLETSVMTAEPHKVTDHLGRHYTANYILDCTGAYQDHMNKNHKVVFGSYYAIPYDYTSPSFAWNLNQINILFHSKSSKLVIGATTQNDQSMVADLFKMKNWQHSIDELFAHKGLPAIPWKLAKLNCGLRSKGPKRLPSFHWDQNTFQISSLYKNGLMYSVWGLQTLGQKIRLHPKLQL